MNRIEAMELYFSKNAKSAKTLNRLEKWDDAKTLTENGKALFSVTLSANTKAIYASGFASKYGLKAIKAKRVSKKKVVTPKKPKKVVTPKIVTELATV